MNIFGFRKNKDVQIISIDDHFKKLIDCYDEREEKDYSSCDTLIELERRVTLNENDLNESYTDISQIEEMSPLMGFFIKSSITKDLNERVFGKEIKGDSIYSYHKKKSSLEYICLTKINSIKKSNFRDNKNNVFIVKDVYNDSKFLIGKYTNDKGLKFNVGINVFYGVCNLL